MEDLPQPNIRFFRTKRFWFRWAVPGLLLALWVEASLYDQQIRFSFITSTSQSLYFIASGRGNFWIAVQRFRHLPVAAGFHGFGNFNAGFARNSGVELFPDPLHYRKQLTGPLTYQLYSKVTIPLWFPLILWLLIAHLWSRHQNRKQAALQTTSEIPAP
jgi:hypothetical protein